MKTTSRAELLRDLKDALRIAERAHNAVSRVACMDAFDTCSMIRVRKESAALRGSNLGVLLDKYQEFIERD